MYFRVHEGRAVINASPWRCAGFVLKASLLFPPSPPALNSIEWTFNLPRLASSSAPPSAASSPPSGLSSIKHGRAGGQSGEREPRSRAPADGRTAPTRHQHADAGQIRRGRVHGWHHDRGRLRRWGQRCSRDAAEIPLYETPVPRTVPGWNRVLGGPHSAAHPHPEGNQEITVGHRIRRVSKSV